MKLSVIVPVYNMAGEGKLEYCLNSLLHQTLEEPYEILAVDDASTDNSLEVLRKYEKEYPGRVRVIACPENRRQGGAKNIGLGAARGEWISFIDSDDWVSPDFYGKLLQKAEETGADMVGCDYTLVDRHTLETGRVVQNNTPEQTGVLDGEKHKLLLLRPGSMVIKIYRHRVIRDNRLDFPEKIFYEDNCAGPLWSLYFEHFEKVEEPLYYYYQHPESTVHRVTREKCFDRMVAAGLFYEACRERGFLERYRQEIEYRFTETYYINTLFSYMQGVKHPGIPFVRELYRGVRARFPDFLSNPYYLEKTGAEERKLIALQARSTLLFYCYYRLQLWWRRLKHAL